VKKSERVKRATAIRDVAESYDRIIGFSCIRIKGAIYDELGYSNKAARETIERAEDYGWLFMPDYDDDPKDPWLDGVRMSEVARDEWRRTALCLYAAMIEAGDA